MKTLTCLVLSIAFLACFLRCQNVTASDKPQEKPKPAGGEKPAAEKVADPKAKPNPKAPADPNASPNVAAPNSTEKIAADAGVVPESDEEPNLD